MTTDEKKKSATRLRWRVILPALCLPLLASLFYFVLLSDSVLGRVIYSSTKVFTLIWPVVALVWILKERTRFKFSFAKEDWRRHLRSLPLGILLGLAIVGIMFLLMKTPIGRLVEAGGPSIHEKIVSLGILNHYLLFAFFVSVIHSLLEEFYWRWFVYGQLRELVPQGWAHIIAAIGFSAHHIVVTTQFFSPVLGVIFGLLVGVGGWFWSQLYQRQGTLAGAWISHLIADVGLLYIGYYLAGLDS